MPSLLAILDRHRADYDPVVPFDTTRDTLYSFDFTERNTSLAPDDIANTECFATWINNTLRQHHARYGIGGYGEHRTLYARSAHFDQPVTALAPTAARPERPLRAGSEVSRSDSAGPRADGGSAFSGSELPETAVTDTAAEPRRLHLGVDIWGPAGTKVMAPLDGIVHSFAFNNNDSDYGATIILTHHLDGIGFHTLYGHLSLNSLKNLYEGQHITKGEVIAEFGMRFENGNWPPHLHFQVIGYMQGWKGDYPGVCRFSERMQWLADCPDPNIILKML
jgi:murein DD-endopeptidase MepM/ murein hydrolase activator NlpD